MDFDFDRIRAQLETATIAADGDQDGDDDGGPALRGGWLAESWRDPARFWRTLARYHAALSSPAAKSHPGEGFDFYHDLVLRHRPERVALRSYSRQTGWRTTCYRDLDARSTALAGEWVQRGLQPGEPVCLVLPMGEELVVALLTALRLGLTFSYLPPLGARFVATRLGQLGDPLVVTVPTYLSLIGGARALLLADLVSGRATTRRLLHSYAPDATVAQLFSELVEATDRPLPLRADHFYLGALRDAILLCGMRPGDMAAAPGLSALQHQPSLIVGTLLCGGTWVHIEVEDLVIEPALLTQQPLRAVGISSAARDALLRARAGQVRGWDFWWRNPEEPYDVETWRTFVKRLGLTNVPSANLLVDASAGGSVLWSPRRRGHVHTEVLPAPGRPWSLASVSGSDAAGRGPRAMGDFGLLAPEAPARPPYVILVRAGARFLYGGTRGARSAGRVYPMTDVVALARNHPRVIDAAVVLDRSGPFGQPLRILCAFTGAARAQPGDEDALARTIAQELGPELVPDSVQLLPLYPRLLDGAPDPRWCASQQVMGQFFHKPRQAPHQALTLLRRALALGGPAVPERIR
jgi:hypothetical protein